MSVKPDGAPSGEAAAHRRWLVTIAITILFGGFGAVMTYLTYARSTRPFASSPAKPPSTMPNSDVAPPPAVKPPAEDSSGGEDHKGKPDKEDDAK